ncbi:MAG TPA: hypothetical protein VNR38_05180 [Ureibacillus sp.]|nr:hypothetical protein [Ureibacillus sp.]
MSIIDRILKRFAEIGEISAYGIIENLEETSEEIHISEEQINNGNSKPTTEDPVE